MAGSVEIRHVLCRGADRIAVVFCNGFRYDQQRGLVAKIPATRMDVFYLTCVPGFIDAFSDRENDHEKEWQRQKNDAYDEEAAPQADEQQGDERDSANQREYKTEGVIKTATGRVRAGIKCAEK